jgi:hypothetical protein
MAVKLTLRIPTPRTHLVTTRFRKFRTFISNAGFRISQRMDADPEAAFQGAWGFQNS